MHPQLSELEQELRQAVARADDLSIRYSAEEWRARPSAGGWSASECVAHLNLTAAYYLPVLDDALAEGRAAGGAPPARLRRDPVGWLIWSGVRPGRGMKVSTSPAFVPTGDQPRDALLAEYRRLNAEVVARLGQSDSVPVHRIKLSSPFARRVRYSLFSAFSIIASHEHRHLGQAERALEATRGQP